MFDWDDLRHLLAVAKTGTSAGAARMLGVSQPTVVRRIAALEEQLHLVLFDRMANGYRLTVHGHALLAQARDVEKAIQGFDTIAKSHSRSADASIRLTVFEALVPALTPLIAQFRKRYPAVTVEMHSDNAWLDISKGEADIAIRAGRWSGSDDLVGTEFAHVGWALYASPLYLDERGVPDRLDDLRGHTVIGGEGELARTKAYEWLEARSETSAILSRANVLSVAVGAVKAGLGLAPLPCAVAAQLPGVEAASGPIEELRGSLWVLTRKDLRLHPPIKHLMELIVRELEAQRPVFSGEDIALRR